MASVRRDIRGNWSADDMFDLPDGRKLKVSTHKTFSGTLVTTATAGRLEGGFFSYTMYQDFSKRVIESRPKKCTSQYVEAQHASALEELEDVKKAVAEYYSCRVPA